MQIRFINVRYSSTYQVIDTSPAAKSPVNSLLIPDHNKPTLIPRKLSQKYKSFIDFKRIKITPGNGGHGAISFEKSAKVIFGPANGGNGGPGGNIYIRASKSHTTLSHLSTLITSPAGTSGKQHNLHGAAGQDVEIIVPIGTTVRQVESTSASHIHTVEKVLKHTTKYDLLDQCFRLNTNYTPREDRVEWLFEKLPVDWKCRYKLDDGHDVIQDGGIRLDLLVDGERHLVCKGGRGGKGNPYFVTNEIKGPPFSLKGEPTCTISLELELKTIADIGLVGLPNAGKSSFLSVISKKTSPKIAAYPFTTLNPYIGVVEFKDYFTMDVADIPGIFKGSCTQNFGLGHVFLRHIERSKIYCFIIDFSSLSTTSTTQQLNDFSTLIKELYTYNPAMIFKPSTNEKFKYELSKNIVIVANKCDKSSAQNNLEQFKRELQENVSIESEKDCLLKDFDISRVPIIPISAKYKSNINVVAEVLRSFVEEK